MNEVVRPFELTDAQLEPRLDEMVEVTFADLTSQFLLLPRGDTFLTYEDFRDAYESLRLATHGFADLTVTNCWKSLMENARAFIALRAILGMSPPEWQDVTGEHTGISIRSGVTRGIEGRVKRNPRYFSKSAREATLKRVEAMLTTACELLRAGAPESTEGFVHRLDKIDTEEGTTSLRYAAQYHVPYAALLYERYLGRPFASHRDAVSELVGDVMESAIEERLTRAGIPFMKPGRAEQIPGFDQAPDFVIPDQSRPAVVIEAKMSSDDGTARDKVARILRLAQMRDQKARHAWQLVACIDGRGFGVRTRDVRDL